MTPAQRQYDLELAASMRLQATQVASRSRKIADTLNAAADRIEALSACPVPVDPGSQTARVNIGSGRDEA